MGGVARLSYPRRPMPVQPCPMCNRATAKDLEATNKIAYVNYYTCEACLHIWTTDRKTASS